MIDAIPEFTQKLEEYLNNVRKETGRKIILDHVQSVGLPGMHFGFEIGAENIHIACVLPYPGSQKQFEQSIAHEATHGLLVFARGFSELSPKLSLSRVDSFAFSLIGTMVDDVPVNKILEEEEFSPLAENYFHMIDKETKAARLHQREIYQNAAPDAVSQRRFMICRYVKAWANRHYYNLSLSEKETLNRFRKAFRRAYTQEAEEGDKIQELFERHDVFTPEGHGEIIGEVLTIWDLDGKVELKLLRRPGEI